MTEAIKKLVEEIKTIKEDIKYIKKHMIDSDMLLKPSEELRLKESVEAYKAGKSTSLDDFEEENSD